MAANPSLNPFRLNRDEMEDLREFMAVAASLALPLEAVPAFFSSAIFALSLVFNAKRQRCLSL